MGGILGYALKQGLPSHLVPLPTPCVVHIQDSQLSLYGFLNTVPTIHTQKISQFSKLSLYLVDSAIYSYHDRRKEITLKEFYINEVEVECTIIY